MQPIGQLINRRWRLRLHAGTALLSLALWLFMAVAEEYPALHAWLHGGTIPDNDDCAVVAIAHGKVETAIIAAPSVLPLPGIEIVFNAESFVFCPTPVLLPDGRGPPVLFSVS
jgi:hypothetical protein